MIWVLLSICILIVAAYPPAAVPVIVLFFLTLPAMLRWYRSAR